MTTFHYSDVLINCSSCRISLKQCFTYATLRRVFDTIAETLQSNLPTLNLRAPSCHYSTPCGSGEMKLTSCIQFPLPATQNASSAPPSLTRYPLTRTTSYLICRVSERTRGQKKWSIALTPSRLDYRNVLTTLQRRLRRRFCHSP